MASGTTNCNLELEKIISIKALKYKEAYIDVDQRIFTDKIRRQRIARLRKQAAELGLEVTEKELVA